MRMVTAEDLAALPSPLTAGTRQTNVPNPLMAYQLAEEMNAGGVDLADLLAGARTMIAAIDSAHPSVITAMARVAASPSLLDLDPDAAAALCRETALDLSLAAGPWTGVGQILTDRLGQDFDAAFTAQSDPIIMAMRPQWDEAVAAIIEAHEAGLTPQTDPQEILANGDPRQITAYRALRPAAAILDRIAGVRIRMCNSAGAGPISHPIACLIDAKTDLELEGAANTYTGKTEVAFMTVMSATSPHHVPVSRLGGAWLALISNGYTLRLNTADEATAVVTKAAKA